MRFAHACDVETKLNSNQHRFIVNYLVCNCQQNRIIIFTKN